MIVECVICNKEIKVYPKRLKKTSGGICCSRKCSGILSSRKYSKKIKTNCQVCNKEIFYKKSHFKNIKNHTCSINCSSILKKTTNLGERNPRAKYNSLNEMEKYFNHRVQNLKVRSDAKKIDFNLTYKDLIELYNKQHGRCHYSGLKFAPFNSRGIKYNTLSVDRVDSLKGYTLDNVVLCLHCVNMLKSNHNLEIIKSVFKSFYLNEKRKTELSVKKLYSDALLPSHSDELAAGYDIYVHRIEDYGNYIKVYSGIAIQPKLGYYFMLVPRSSIYKTGLSLYNNIGIIDVNYVGEIIGFFNKTNDFKSLPKVGDRLLQLIPQEQIWIDIIETHELSTTERGSGGFGSTGT